MFLKMANIGDAESSVYMTYLRRLVLRHHDVVHAAGALHVKLRQDPQAVAAALLRLLHVPRIVVPLLVRRPLGGRTAGQRRHLRVVGGGRRRDAYPRRADCRCLRWQDLEIRIRAT